VSGLINLLGNYTNGVSRAPLHVPWAKCTERAAKFGRSSRKDRDRGC